MATSKLDTRAILIPTPMIRGLELLFHRVLGTTNSSIARNLMEKLFGTDVSFGSLAQVTTKEVNTACERLKFTPLSITSPKELIDLFSHISPELPVCTKCNELPISWTGGNISELPVGASCPYCSDGTVELVPIKLRMLAWTNGNLVEPQTKFDLRTQPGTKLPLHDDDIIEWVGGFADKRLVRALNEHEVPIYGFLAYYNLVLRKLETFEDAARLLQKLRDFDLNETEALQKAVCEAGRLLAEREETNLPPKPALSNLLGRPIEDAKRITIAGRTYIIEGRVGQGDSCDVFRAFWDHIPTERVIIKVCRAIEDADLVEREADVMGTLRRSEAAGSHFFVTLIPEILAFDYFTDAGGVRRPVMVRRDKNMFDWTLADVLKEYPRGVESDLNPRHLVWMWKNILTASHWVHLSGFVHGAIIPSHVLLNAPSHAATLLGWTAATKFGRGLKNQIEVISAGNEAFYPKEVFTKEASNPATDIAMGARCMIAVAGGDPATGQIPDEVPEPIAEMLRVHARYEDGPATRRLDDALELHNKFERVADEVYGPRKFIPFIMPRPSKR